MNLFGMSSTSAIPEILLFCTILKKTSSMPLLIRMFCRFRKQLNTKLYIVIS